MHILYILKLNSSGPCDNDDDGDYDDDDNDNGDVDNDDDDDHDDDDDDDDIDDDDIRSKLILKLLFQSTAVPFRLVWKASKCLILHF